MDGLVAARKTLRDQAVTLDSMAVVTAELQELRQAQARFPPRQGRRKGHNREGDRDVCSAYAAVPPLLLLPVQIGFSRANGHQSAWSCKLAVVYAKVHAQRVLPGMS